MKTFLLMLATQLLFAAVASAQDGLTAITRSSCTTYPRILELAEMRPNFDYTLEVEYSDIENCGQECDDVTLKVSYYYRHTSIVDYYTRAGKLVTTQKQTSQMSMDFEDSDSGMQGQWAHYPLRPSNDVAKKQLFTMHKDLKEWAVDAIHQSIYRSGTTVCEDSHYH